MFQPLVYVLKKLIVRGNLQITDAKGRVHVFGDPSAKRVAIRITDAATERRVTLNPGLAIGEAYADGRLIVEHGTVYDFLEVILQDLDPTEWPGWAKIPEALRFLTRRLQQYNPVSRAKKNVAHHYDIDGSIYDLFLDSDRQYSCGYFERPDATLDEAQKAKKRHLAAKLVLREGQKVLDIGSGWGGLALYLAQLAGVEVTGITLSEEQLKLSRERARNLGLSRVVDFQLRDYRQIQGPFDRIVSVGMFEHVGLSHYPTFFRRVRELLADDGVAVIHAIGRSPGPGVTNQFIAKYIFPGGYIPAVSEVLPAVEREGLITTDIEILRLHYAMTLRQWRQRFRASWHIMTERFGERFCRVWEFYLAASETAFRYQGMMVFQIQLARRQDAVPLTRDYIYEAEREFARRELSSLRQQSAATPE